MIVYICDDNQAELNMIEKIIKKSLLTRQDSKIQVKKYSEPYDFLNSLNFVDKAVYFLDVKLNAKMDGIELAKIIREKDKRSYIVFITAYGAMAVYTYLHYISAFEYILKDNYATMQKRIELCLERIFEMEKKETFLIKFHGLYIKINLTDIYSFEHMAGSHKILMYGENQQMQFCGTLKELALALDKNFYRCSESAIVNIRQIQAIDQNKRLLILKSGDEYNISIRRMKGLLECFLESV